MRASQHPEAVFLATMTASATHEVRNVLAIIKESAGLMEDMIHVFEKRGTLDPEKVCRAVERIEVQVKRGAEILTNLNRLSHTLDSDLTSVELHREVEQLVFLSQRFARKKAQRVVAGGLEEGCTVSVNQLHLHMALFTAMERCMEELPDGSSMTVEVRRSGGRPVVEFKGAAMEGREVEPSSEPEGWTRLEGLALALGTSVERSGDGFGIRILFPQGTGG